MYAARRILAALAASALLAGCGVPEAMGGHDEQPTVHPDQQKAATAGGGESPLPSDAGSLASMAQQLAGQGDPGSSAAPGASPSSLLPGTGGGLIGGDVSWPQCPPGMGIPKKKATGQPMPLPDAAFVVVGLTNGPGFVRNPCLKSQVQWVKIHKLPISAYSVVSYPSAADLAKYGAEGPYDATTETGRLQNVGYAQATYNVGSMGLAGLDTPVVWLDVETVPDFDWPANNAAKNAAVVRGAAKGYQDAGYDIGVYGTPTIWKTIVGGLKLGSDVVEWRAAGTAGPAEALSRCNTSWSIQGGRAILGQWVDQRRDRSLVCPGVGTDLSPWFHRT